jgi:hypothetical protein
MDYTNSRFLASNAGGGKALAAELLQSSDCAIMWAQRTGNRKAL